MKKYIIPSKNNNYTPILLHRSALVIYVLVIFIFNVVVGQMSFSSVQASVDASALYSLHNSSRAANGIGGLSVNSQLVTSATNKAQAMLSSDCWDHYCPSGTSPWSFILNTGYEYIYAGENLGEGFTNSNTLMNAWMNSPSHRVNVLNGNFTEIGIGFAHGSFQGNPNNTVVVVHFGSKGNNTPKPNPPADTPIPVTTKTATATPTKKPVVTSAPKPSPTTIPNIVIDSPQDGAILNTAEPEILGKKPDLSNLKIYVNEEDIGSVDTRGENFSFRPGKLEDGEVKLKAVGFINNKQVTSSPEISFTVDTISPEVSREDLEISYSGDKNTVITMKLKTSADSIKVFSSTDKGEFKKEDESVWILTTNKSQVEENAVFSITAEDNAGNQTILEIPTREILGYYDHNLYLNEEGREITRTNISGPLLGSIANGGVRTRVNFIFISFLLLLFSLDFYFINKSGLTGIRKSKSHLQISAIVILFMVVLVGGFTGSIL